MVQSSLFVIVICIKSHSDPPKLRYGLDIGTEESCVFILKFTKTQQNLGNFKQYFVSNFLVYIKMSKF